MIADDAAGFSRSSVSSPLVPPKRPWKLEKPKMVDDEDHAGMGRIKLIALGGLCRNGSPRKTRCNRQNETGLLD